MEDIKCVIFDCDGVLVDSEIIGNQILLSMSKEYGLEMTIEDAIKNFNGRSLKDSFQQIEKLTSNRLPDNFESEYRKQTFEAFKTELKPIKGVKKFIDSLSISYCVASSGPIEKIHLNLTTTGLIEKFENKIFSSYQINSWKPDPEIFLFASREMGFTTNECIVIEDSKAGVISAKKGGFKVYGFANENNEKELKDEGAIIFYSFEELANLLNMDKLN
ncbi:HAD family hydrolase [Flavobacterium psychrophilum]|uniref:HAD family hydrolase n=1 Tax=Flavobacterium psychrophilum TaxID=96345 RepID=UPI0004F70C3F|nr:HAD family hydrolase [Flavobacterium psychrophilum]AIN74091.1 HAD family hydrolase [Flavobacterium psychrophilum FPG3]EKT2070426.1 HAD family hydrolase [Flavobacterium psychrophilum]EKT2072836.1 HAD family hydrolase [Flavobacterium psychrophilum]EKT4492246.1 HAD family hydrolase [Flavobacterium psychrophilum]MBF2045576.1 HAD family hydrolase [Flavobacterium psychrophilum]